MFMLLMVTGAMRAAGNSMLPMALVVGANVLNIVLDIWFVFGGSAYRDGRRRRGWVDGCFPTRCRGHRPHRALSGGFAGLLVRRFVWHWVGAWRVLWSIASCAQWLVRWGLYRSSRSSRTRRRVPGSTPPRRKPPSAWAAPRFACALRRLRVGAAAATFVGQNLGRGLPDRTARATWIALGFNILMMLLFAGGYVLFAEPLLGAMGFDVGRRHGRGERIEGGRVTST